MPDSLPLAILSQVADALIYADPEGRIALWNTAAESLFGYPAAVALGQSLDLIIPERLRPAHWAGYHRAIEQGRTRHAGRPTLTKALHQSGEAIYVEMTFAVVTDDDGKSMGSVAMARAGSPPQRA